MMLRDRLFEEADRKKTRTILALDLVPEKSRELRDIARMHRMLEDLRPHVAAVKIGHPSILSLGLGTISQLIDEFKKNYAFVADLKIADVSHVNRIISSMMFDSGFDAVIVHGIIGVKGGIDGVVEVAKDKGKDFLVLVSMSHEGSRLFIDRNLEGIVKDTINLGSSGYVAPATRPQVVSRLREMIGRRSLILSPGVGKQGAECGSAILNGADFEIIGRTIYQSRDPARIAKRIARKQIMMARKK
jgi:orotidine-5'-phosphate decarboxylase